MLMQFLLWMVNRIIIHGVAIFMYCWREIASSRREISFSSNHYAGGNRNDRGDEPMSLASVKAA